MDFFVPLGLNQDFLGGIFDENEKWTVTDFDSKSSNSPFVGCELLGKVKYTISEGKIVYTDK